MSNTKRDWPKYEDLNVDPVPSYRAAEEVPQEVPKAPEDSNSDGKVRSDSSPDDGKPNVGRKESQKSSQRVSRKAHTSQYLEDR